MCPSFHVTNDEKDTTRARAQSLLAALAKENPITTFRSKRLYDIMDLCIECKGCKSECPSQVDMAKMKAEFLYHYYQSNQRRFRDYFFGTGLGIIVGTFIFTFFIGTLKEVWVSGNWAELISFKVFFSIALFIFSFFIPKIIKKVKGE